MDRPILPITYDQLDQWIYSLQPELAREGFVCAVGVLRGGGPLALMVSHTIGVPAAFVRYERKSRTVAWDSSILIPPAGSKVLVCDDIAGVGHTLVDCIEFLLSHRLIVKTLTAGFDHLSHIRPDYGIDGRGYFLLLPWERHSYTDEYRVNWKRTDAGQKGRIGEDHEFEIYGLDLDGILLPDVPLARYEADLTSALCERERLAPHSRLPPVNVHRAKVIITGRPEMDRARTATWLQKHGFESVPLVMRDPANYDDSPKSVAAHKAQAAIRHACTHFVESDPVQAIEIAMHAPLLRVVWWDALANRGRLVAAHQWGSSGDFKR